MNDCQEKVCICCKNCKHREKYSNHCSLLDREIFLYDYCSLSFYKERDDLPNYDEDIQKRGETNG